MKKEPKKYNPHLPLNIVNEPDTIYQSPYKTNKTETLVKEFTYNDFKQILNKGPFTLAEWADMLFISERSLHRYAKDDGGFNGLQIERILLLENLIDTGNDLFGQDGFKRWLPSSPFSFGGKTVKNKLTTHNEIQDTIDTLQRMQHGISA